MRDYQRGAEVAMNARCVLSIAVQELYTAHVDIL